jgi:hypothetical protein
LAGNAEDALKADSWWGQVKQWFAKGTKGKSYSSEKVLDLIKKSDVLSRESSSTSIGQITQSDGSVWQKNADGSYTRIK